jgi:hypothetical protein
MTETQRLRGAVLRERDAVLDCRHIDFAGIAVRRRGKDGGEAAGVLGKLAAKPADRCELVAYADLREVVEGYHTTMSKCSGNVRTICDLAAAAAIIIACPARAQDAFCRDTPGYNFPNLSANPVLALGHVTSAADRVHFVKEVAEPAGCPGRAPACAERAYLVPGDRVIISARHSRSQHPEYAVQHAAIIDARHASRLVRQERLDHAPLEVGQVISAHAEAESGFHSMGKTASR